MWKIFLVVEILVTVLLIAIVALAVHATSVKVETWGMTKEYEEGFEFIFQWTPPEFSTTIVVAIGNPSAFTVTVRHMTVRLILNGIYMGSLSFQEEWYKIPPFDWRTWTATYTVTGDDADSLESADTYDVYVSLRGEATCMFHRTLFETTHQKTYTI